MDSYMTKFDALKMDVESTTGFHCFESIPGAQPVFYGTSDEFDEFKEKVSGKIPTGSIAYTMDDNGKYMYSFTKDTWYEL